ncbi:MAG: VOC family protein [Pseudomonadales bacterium]|jgi:catechol 2,3-dioxygenase-like lactoylglutathione lyase family enzyme
MKLEHANLSVVHTEEMERFLLTAFPDFRRRGEGEDSQGRHWRHVGNDTFYVALQTVPDSTSRTPYDNGTGLNHLGWEVDDLAALEIRMRAAGFAPNMAADDHPARRRRYFYDPDGNDWEFIEYLVEDVDARNDYGR